MSLQEQLGTQSTLYIKQRRELAELIGFETRNKYSIETEHGEAIGFAAEQQKGILGFLLRQFLGHWRTYEIYCFDSLKQLSLKAVHPFRFLFQRLEVFSSDGVKIGAVQQRFSVFTKKFDVLDDNNQILMTVASPFWKIWTFAFQKQNQTVATIKKKWSGLLTEVFTDQDQFRIEFNDPNLNLAEKTLLLVSGLFIDLQYFERKAGRR
ncbi:MAG: hypothetical protein HY072_02105 [Deltaproteobacteria bacterium]|nr:hypothetical protein [Deltaproteobacteria bacterium]